MLVSCSVDSLSVKKNVRCLGKKQPKTWVLSNLCTEKLTFYYVHIFYFRKPLSLGTVLMDTDIGFGVHRTSPGFLNKILAGGAQWVTRECGENSCVRTKDIVQQKPSNFHKWDVNKQPLLLCYCIPVALRAAAWGKELGGKRHFLKRKKNLKQTMKGKQDSG